jgi:hypothetical protein
VRNWGLLVVLAAVLAGCGVPGQSDDHEVELGAWEYFVRDADPAIARTKMADATAAGFGAVITNAFWEPGRTAPTALEVTELQNAANAARAAKIRPLLIVQSPGSKTTPNTAGLRQQFAQYTAAVIRRVPAYQTVIVGNEPNLNRFWLPQYGPDGEDVAARDYLALLAATYDALKAVSVDIRVVGGATAPRGGDDVDSSRPTHSPTQFIRDLGRYYRESGRDQPVMDAYAHHPYMERSEVPPDFAHPNTTTISLADYDKLVNVLKEAFDGTAQEGEKLPILYTEFGVQSIIPEDKLSAYTNLRSPVAKDAVPEEKQADYYRQAYELACDQDTVVGLYLFHIWDEPDLLGWQSGVYYADHTPKSSRDAVADLRSC